MEGEGIAPSLLGQGACRVSGGQKSGDNCPGLLTHEGLINVTGWLFVFSN